MLPSAWYTSAIFTISWPDLGEARQSSSLVHGRREGKERMDEDEEDDAPPVVAPDGDVLVGVEGGRHVRQGSQPRPSLLLRHSSSSSSFYSSFNS